MRRIRYEVAASLDGYISGPDGEIDWIVMDPEIDFDALFERFDTLLIGRKTYEEMIARGGLTGGLEKMRALVFSRTWKQEDHPDVTIVSTGAREVLLDLCEQPGKDIWLFGGGELFRSVLDAGLVDSVSVAVIPVVLGTGRPLLPEPYGASPLNLTRHTVYARTGTVILEYDVDRG